MSDFHFSPRPNRAHEIGWNAWDPAAFATAREERKPILLSISAVWCHWCHVMDETTYSDPLVIDAIRDHFIPVRVDNDRRPDVNARYNQGGWPTTAFLTPQGDVLAGATYLPPEQMRSALEQIAQFYRTDRERIEERAAQARTSEGRVEQSESSRIPEYAIARTLALLAEAYDSEYGGFGDAPKFPMLDALEFLLQEYRVTGEQHLYDMVAKTMLGMSGGGMYDHVEGGFFRYSTTRDWSVPHFEKMTEDHAGYVRLLAQLVRTRNESFRTTLISTLRYVRSVLADPQTHLYAGSQDADEAYYELSLEQRRAQQAPYVDRTSYSNWTAALAGALVLAGAALDDDETVGAACATLDALHERMLDETGLLYHFIEPGGEPQVRGLLTDQAAYLRALLDAHEHTGEARFLQRALDLAAAIERTFAAPDGAFYDRIAQGDELGHLRVRDRPLGDNALLAESLLRLADLRDDDSFRRLAERTLGVYARSHERSGLFGAGYARAVRRWVRPAMRVVLVGSPQETDALREAAHALPEPYLSVRTIEPGDTNELLKRGFDPQLTPAAYVCNAAACAAPAGDPSGLREAYEQLFSSRVG